MREGELSGRGAGGEERRAGVRRLEGGEGQGRAPGWEFLMGEGITLEPIRDLGAWELTGQENSMGAGGEVATGA